MLRTLSKLCAGLAFCIGLLLSTHCAWALTAANTQIVNQARLTYSGGSATASVTVTVALVQAKPTITAGPAQTTQYAGAATQLTDAFTVTTNANGPDSYTITSAIANAGGTNSASPVVSTSASSSVASTVITLGATVTTIGSTASVLNVPSDGTPGTTVNGIQAGSSVVIGTATATVSSVSNPGGSGVATISLNAALPSAPPAGSGIFEQKILSVYVQSGTISTAGSDIAINVTTTAAVSTNPSAYSANSAAVVNIYHSGAATLTKYVRNVTSGMPGSGTSFTINGQPHSYATSGVTAKPGEVLEYLVVATNTGTGSIDAAVISDLLPTGYVVFKTGAYGASKDIDYINDTTESQLTATADGDNALVAGANLTVNVGSGATNSAGGSMAAGKTATVAYQVTVNP